MKLLKFIFKIHILLLLTVLLNGCVDKMKERLSFPDNIDEKEIVANQEKQISRTTQAGPQKQDEDSIKTKGRRVRLTSEEIDESSFFGIQGNKKLFMNAHDVDIRALAEVFSKSTGTNIVVGQEVDSKVRLRLENISVVSAFDIVISSHGLYQVMSANSSIISIHTPEVARSMAIEGAEKIRRKNTESVTEIFRIHYAKLPELKASLEGIFTKEGASGDEQLTITADDRTRTLIVNGRPEIMDSVSEIIGKLDKRTNVILIEAVIVLAKDTFAEALGSRLGLTRDANYKMSGNTGNSSAGNATGTAALTDPAGTATQLAVGDSTGSVVSTIPTGAITAGIGIITGLRDLNQLKIAIAALETENLSRILSNPRIFTMDNTTASISKGDQIPYKNSTSTEAGQTIQFVDAALRLEVTPSVIGDGNVILKIKLNNDSADTSLSEPPISKTEINTELLVRSGEIVVIGGTTVDDKSQSNTRVPYLSDLPFIGELFKGVSNNDKLTELLIFICPIII